jgi:hypothetical protein
VGSEMCIRDRVWDGDSLLSSPEKGIDVR